MSSNVIFDLLIKELVVSVLDLTDFFDLTRLESATTSKRCASSLQEAFAAYRLNNFPKLEEIEVGLNIGFDWLLNREIQFENIRMNIATFNQVIRNERYHQLLKDVNISVDIEDGDINSDLAVGLDKIMQHLRCPTIDILYCPSLLLNEINLICPTTGILYRSIHPILTSSSCS